jgi:uncharacterized protein
LENKKQVMKYGFFSFIVAVVLLFCMQFAFAADQTYPDKPNPPRLVNDFAHCLSAAEVARLEQKLEQYATSSSTQITIVTINNLGGMDKEQYAVELFNRWGLGQKDKNNGVLLFVSVQDRAAWITVGTGLEGVMTDAKSGTIFRNELAPAFKEGHYFEGFSDACDAIIAVTKGEYTADKHHAERGGRGSFFVVIIIFIIILFFLRGNNRRGGRGGGMGDIATGMIIGEMLGGLGNRRGGGWGDSGSGNWGGGGFGGFGGGSSAGGGAGGNW